jgi:hypothetical protein
MSSHRIRDEKKALALASACYADKVPPDSFVPSPPSFVPSFLLIFPGGFTLFGMAGVCPNFWLPYPDGAFAKL